MAMDWKMPVAGTAAVVGIGLAAWQAWPSRSERTDIPKPKLVRADGTTAMPEQRRAPSGPPQFEADAEDAGRSYSFERVKNASDVAVQMDSLVGAIEQTGRDADLATNVRTLIEPLNAGSKEGLDSAVASLGGVSQTEDGGSTTDGLYSLFAGLLEFVSLDASEIEVRKPTRELEPGQEGMSISMNRSSDENPDTGEVVDTMSTNISGTPTRLFPLAAGESATGEVMEVRLPFRSKGSKSKSPDIVMLLQMRRVAGKGWQPSGFICDVRNKELMDEVLGSIMAQAQQQRQGG